jgi:hypothetical protein
MSDAPKMNVRFWDTGGVYCETYTANGVPHRIDGPAELHYYKDGVIESKRWYKEGSIHREDGPARIWYYRDGSIRMVDFWLGDRYLKFWDFYDRVSEADQKILLKNWIHHCHV